MTTDSYLLGPDLRGVWMVVEGDRITGRGTGTPTEVPAVRHLDWSAGVIAPGAVNAHTHMYNGLVPLGMPTPRDRPTDFLQILERIWWRLDRALDEDSLRAAARLYVAEALLAGTTALIDHHESPEFIEGSLDVIADVCAELGMRALLCYGATERNDGREEGMRGLRECRRFIEDNLRPLIRGAVGLHASFTVSNETVQEAASLCKDLDTILHVHLAEDLADVRDAEKRGYAGPLERFEALKALVPHSILAHGVHLDAAQVKRTEEAACWLIQNPRSNHGNDVGYPRALGASKRVALGTDGYPADMTAEADFLADQAQISGERPEAAAVRSATGSLMSSELLGAPSTSSALEWDIADVRVIDEAGGTRHVMIEGRLVVEDGMLVNADLDEIRQHAREQAARLWKRMEGI